MNDVAALRSVKLFAGLSDDDLERLRQSLASQSLAPGELLFEEGDAGDRAYLVLSGEMEIVKRTERREVILAVSHPGAVVGEMALLREAPRIASARARTPAELLIIPKAQLDELLASSTTALRAMFDVMLDRWQATQSQLRQSERMAQLGTLTAGLAHEINNPAAAVARVADRLPAAVERLRTAERRMSAGAGEEAERLAAFAARWTPAVADPAQLDAVARSDREAAIEDSLEAHGVEDAWRLAPGLVAAGFDPDLDGVFEVAGDRSGEVLEMIDATRDIDELIHEAKIGSGRILGLVDALKSYVFLDQAPIQVVDLIGGIEDTLLILGSKLRGIEVRREYAPDLPTIEAHGAELNQVWTNLIDNAADSIRESGQEHGVIVIRVSADSDMVTVEIEDNGAGIESEALDRVFDSFYTTKPPGSGTGLGLHISYGIVVHEHRGEIGVASEPGSTRFTVSLPRRAE